MDVPYFFNQRIKVAPDVELPILFCYRLAILNMDPLFASFKDKEIRMLLFATYLHDAHKSIRQLKMLKSVSFDAEISILDSKRLQGLLNAIVKNNLRISAEDYFLAFDLAIALFKDENIISENGGIKIEDLCLYESLQTKSVAFSRIGYNGYISFPRTEYIADFIDNVLARVICWPFN